MEIYLQEVFGICYSQYSLCGKNWRNTSLHNPCSNFFCQALFETRNFHYFFKKTNQANLTVAGFLFGTLAAFCSCWEVLHVQFYYLWRSWVNNSCASVAHLKQSKTASVCITSAGRERSCAVGVLSRVPVLSLRGRWDTSSLNNNSGLKQVFHYGVIWLISCWE